MKKNISIALLFLAGFLYRLLFSLQGIDRLDLGAANTFYQNIFTHPEALTNSFNYYLTGLVGGVWYTLFGDMGLVGFRLLDALLLTAAVFFVYKAFRRLLVNTHSAVLAILMSFLFPSVVTTFYHYTLSFLFVAIAAWCYSKSLYQHPSTSTPHSAPFSYLWTFLTGVTLGLCCFVRIANCALVVVVLVLIPLVSYLYNAIPHDQEEHSSDEENVSHTSTLRLKKPQHNIGWRMGGTMLGGMLTAAVLMVVIMAALGHLPYFAEAVSYQTSMLNAEHSTLTYYILRELVLYLRSYTNIILQLLAIFGLGALYIQSSRLTSHWATGLKVFLIIASIVLIATSQPYLSAISLYTLLCTPIFYAITPREDKLLAAFVILATYLLPFGTGSGVASVYHWSAALLIVPAAVGVYHTSHIVRKGVLICSLYIAVIMIWRTVSYPYGEQEPRWQCTEQIGGCALNTYTTPQKASDYRHIIAALRQHTAQNSWLLLGNQASELYYATETLPFLGTTKLTTFTVEEDQEQPEEQILSRLNRQEKRYAAMPVIAFLKPDFFQTEYTAEIQEQLRTWMAKHNYQVVSDDDYLTIFKAQQP